MTRLGLSREEQAALGRIADERAARPNAFDALRNTGKLGVGMWTGPVEVKALAARRWAVGDALRRLHAAGWQNPCGGKQNPLGRAEAAAARARLAEIEFVVGKDSWPVVSRVVIAGDDIRDCHDLLPVNPRGLLTFADGVLLDRLCLALDRIAPMLSSTES